MRIRLLLLSIFIFIFSVANSQVVINEYSASNLAITNANFFNNFDDYIELYNAGATPVNLMGYYLSDDKNNTTNWQITSNITLNPGDRIMAFCNKRDTITQVGTVWELHTDFKLTQCHDEYVVLADPGGNIVDSVKMLRTKEDHSRGRITDGSSTWGIFTTPSPNAPNGGSLTDYLARPTMSVAPGFYTATQTVSLATTSPNCEIRYTLNGTTPTPASTLYSAPINVAATTVIRAAAFPIAASANYEASFIETNTYFINVNHAYRVVSLCGNYQGAGGLFVNGQPERSSFEHFDASKNFTYEDEGEVRRHGNDSWAFSQKGMRFHTFDEYGYEAEVRGGFFPNTTRDSFNVVILKAAGSDNFPDGPGGFGANNPAHMRDAYAQTLSIKYGMELDERSYSPAIVYINGQYWGIYELRERVDDDYTGYYYNQGGDNAEILRWWGGWVAGTPAAGITAWNNLANFITSNNMAVATNYQIADSQLNMKSIIDYFLINTYLVNSDWLNWNTMWWRGTKGAGEKWRYTLWDVDMIFDLGINYTGLNSTGPDSDPCQVFNEFQSSNNVKHTQIMSALMANQDFMNLFKTRYTYFLKNTFNCDTLLAHLDMFKNLLLPEMNAHAIRWGGTLLQWQNNMDTVRQFILDRCAQVGGNNDSCLDVKKVVFDVYPAGTGQIKLGNITFPNYPHKDYVTNDTIFNIEAIPIPGYRFVTWQKQDPSNFITPLLTSKNALLDYKKVDSIVAIFEVIPPDTFNVAIDANPRYAGFINVDGITNLTPVDYEYNTKMIEKTQHYLKASPTTINHKFSHWTQKNGATNILTPNLNSDSIHLDIHSGDTLIAWFDTVIFMNYTVTVPNAFSPNVDGMNDVFKIDPLREEYIKSTNMQIFNRYGEVIFNGDALTGWNGIYKDDECEPGTYMYLIKVKFTDDVERVFKGDLTLLH